MAADVIVVGYDGTEAAHAALDVACGLGKELGAKLVFAYGAEPYQGAGEIGGLRAELRKIGEEKTNEAVAAAGERGVEAEARLVADRPAPGLAALASELGARMIVVGSYGEKPITGAILGATPHRLLHLSDVPVLVVPPAE
jgi:nucleotide-binding universal stress UspA family protein